MFRITKDLFIKEATAIELCDKVTNRRKVQSGLDKACFKCRMSRSARFSCSETRSSLRRIWNYMDQEVSQVTLGVLQDRRKSRSFY